MKLMKTLLIAGAMMLSVQAANAENPTIRLSTIVQYGDLDLNRTADVDALYNRLARAAKKVCDAPTSRDLTSLNDFSACKSQAIADAVSDINNSNLSKQHFARTGKQSPVLTLASSR